MVADIYGYYNGTSDLTLESHALSATDDAAVAFLANGGGGGQSGVRAVSKNAAHPASVDSVTAQAGGVSVKVIDGTGASVFARYSDVSGNPKQFEIHGQYSVNFNLPASGSADYDVPLGFNLGSSWLPLGAFFNNANGTASDRCTWRYTNVGASTMRITIANTFSGIGAQSAFFFYVLNVV